MSSDSFNYPALVQKALRSVVRTLLQQVAETGLPGVHHFYITYDTRHPGVTISSELRAKYPETITIILQHDYRDLTVEDDRFSVILRFGGLPQLLRVPFDALVTFYDPTEELALQFDAIMPGPTGPVAVADTPRLTVVEDKPPGSLKVPVRAVLAAADQMQAEKESEAVGVSSEDDEDSPEASVTAAAAEISTAADTEAGAPAVEGSVAEDAAAEDTAAESPAEVEGSTSAGETPEEPAEVASNVVSIDAFRRK